MGAAIDRAIAESLEPGPNCGSLVEKEKGGFIQPPIGPFEKMDETSRARLREAVAAMSRGEKLPAGPEYGAPNPEGMQVSKPWTRGPAPTMEGMAKDAAKVRWSGTRHHQAPRGL